jgi:hypothetical protein
VRRDLSFPQIAVQASHAAYQASSLARPGHDKPHLVLIGIRDEVQLQKALSRIESAGVKCTSFYEPDIENQLTAFATETIFEEQRHLFKRYNCLPDPARQYSTVS